MQMRLKISISIASTQGNELIEEGDGHGHSTLFFISKKNPYPNPEELKSKIANGEVKAFVFKKVRLPNQNMLHPLIANQAKKEETIFTVYTPPHVGFYKLEIYASRVPKTTGKINLPLVATFMLEVCVNMTCCKYSNICHPGSLERIRR